MDAKSIELLRLAQFLVLGKIWSVPFEGTISTFYVLGNRPYIFLTSRVPPGKSNSSSVMKGNVHSGELHESFDIFF